jgi:hypothetical protein
MLDYEMIAAREAIGQTAAAVGDVQASHVAIYLTVLFAYVSVAYLAGQKLTRFQLAIVTFLFVTVAGREVVVIAAMGRLIRVKTLQLVEVYGNAPAQGILLGAGDSILWPVAMWSTGIAASLLFMWSVRHPKTE